MDEGWYDEEFIKENTSLVHLVDRAAGKTYRSAEAMCPNPAVVSLEEVGAPHVWDEAAGEPRLYSESGVQAGARRHVGD